MIEDKILFIVNPKACGGRSLKIWEKKIYPLLTKSNDLKFDYVFTEKPFDGFRLAMKGIEKGYRKLVSVGGDGTLNEIVNAILIQNFVEPTEIAVGSIGTGRGNDWRKTIGIPEDYNEAVNILKNEKYILQDVGKVRYIQNKKEKERFFINIAGMGFDAEVTYKANRKKERLTTSLSYSINLVKTLFSYEPTIVNIIADGHIVYNNKALTLNIGICRYSGGGMMFTPNAIYNDGLFDLTVVDDISILKILANLRGLYNGSFIKNPSVKTFRAKTIDVYSQEKLYLEVDGESLGHSPFHFEILPQTLKVIVG